MKKINKAIKNKLTELENIKSESFKIYSSPHEIEYLTNIASKELKVLYSIKFAKIETQEIKLRLKKMDLSTKLQQLCKI